MRKIKPQNMALPIAKKMLPWNMPPRKPSGTNAAAIVAKLLRILEPP
jgi:hypothetical protein